MKKLVFILLLFIVAQASFASDVRISAKSAVAPAPATTSTSWWDSFIAWF